MLKHVSFVTHNADALIAFYQLLGAQVSKDETHPEEHLRRVVLQCEGGTLQFFEPNEKPERSSKQTSWMEHLAFVVEEFDLLHQAFQQQEVRFTRELMHSHSGKRMFFVLDPDGRQLEILESSGRKMRASVER
ncbi:VOC family protein [Deinococcus roseus]|uniref:Lactoylglutathione lyase n=1 Tax=Deinococcus roseus TaxID=392414 RepID=A0ABQ2D3S6_9DEIO|nr:VOC family protein [Deinococcus roseus]GGJ45108.1 lactoylglutathione lyase [Deinococcus roseus]